MKHHNKNRKFGRDKNQRKALLNSLAISVLKYSKIQTTEAKAKELRPYVEKIITQAKKGNLNDKRLIISKIGNPKLVKNLIEEIAPKYKERNGGYTRIIKTMPRKSDGAKMAFIELV